MYNQSVWKHAAAAAAAALFPSYIGRTSRVSGAAPGRKCVLAHSLKIYCTAQAEAILKRASCLEI